MIKTIGQPLQNVMPPIRNEADELQLLSKGEYKQGFHLVWERFKRTPFLPLRYWMKLIKFFGNYIGIWKR